MAIGVLVVGAGPTGLMLGCELARRGIDFRLIDKLAEPSPLSKAIAVQARSMEILENLGVADAFQQRGLQIDKIKMYADGKPIIQVGFDELATRFPFLLSISQRDSERLLTERLTALGGKLERGVELTALSQQVDAVTVTLRHPDGHDEAVTARWLVGCDGAHSAVRKLSKLDFQGAPFEEPFMLADVKIDWDAPRDQVTTFFSATGIMACFPMPDDRWRLIASAGADAHVAAEPSLADMQRVMDERSGRQSRLHDPQWLAGFRISARQVAKYRSGRVFVAGDAAHIHSPVGGQGMNTGLQDAHNLAWKLALVEQGVAEPELLDSYHLERHRIAADLLRSTDFTTRVATLRNPVSRAVRNRVASFLTSIDVIQERLVKNTAELTLNYKDSPIVGEARTSLFTARIGSVDTAERPTAGTWWRFGKGAAPGERAPDATVYRKDGSACRLAAQLDHRHTLLLFDGAAATAEGYQRMLTLADQVSKTWGDLVAVHMVVPDAARLPSLPWDGSLLVDRDGDLEEQYGSASECLYLLRPDLYVGFRSQPIDPPALLDHFRLCFGRRAAA